MAKKQTDTLAQIDADLATLRLRDAQLLEQQRVANEALQAARSKREQQIVDGNDDVDSLARSAADISECECKLRGVNDACIIVAQKMRQLANKKADEVRWTEQRRISERMTASTQAIEAAWSQFKPARDQLIAALEVEAAIFEIGQTVEHLKDKTGAVLELQMPVIVGELQRGAAQLLNAEIRNPIGVPPLPVEPTPSPLLGPSTGRQAHHGAEWPPKNPAPHSNFPLGEIPAPKQSPTREQILEQNRKALAENYPSIYGEDKRTAMEIFADEQARMNTTK
jgi:hypothetical protein